MLYEEHVIPLVDLPTSIKLQAASKPAAILDILVRPRHVGVVVDAPQDAVQARFSDITLATEDSTRLHPFLERDIQMGESCQRLISIE